MVLFELILGLLLAGASFALWADRVSVPYPALLALVGTVIALVPGAPVVELDPELALALFVAPTLLDAAFDASPRDLRDNLFPLAGLAIGLVVATIAAVAWAARLAVPEMGWAAAITLGAIVAPSDASAATAVLRKLWPPHRLMVILEGESLFNDATSLLIYRVAVGAAVTGAFSGWKVLPMLLLSCGGGVLVGWALAHLQVRVSLRVKDAAINILLQFLGTFAVWIIADRLGISAIITMVVFAMTLARRAGGRMEARIRIASYAVWDVAVLVLNVLAFVLVGLQLQGAIARAHEYDWRPYGLCAGAVCATVILVRIAWVLPYTAVWRGRQRRPGRNPSKALPTYRNAALVSWCGMRGIITLATALALPAAPAAFPHRDIIIFTAYCVVLSTLVFQGMTLRPLIHFLGIRDDGTVEREVGVARAEIARAALRALEAEREGSPAADILRGEYRARLRAEEPLAGSGEGGSRGDGAADLAKLQRRTTEAQREALRALRIRGVIGDDAFHAVEEEIDLLDLAADSRILPLLEKPAPFP